MKYLVVLAVVCAAIGLSEQGLSREEYEGMVDNFLNDCAAKEGATADDITYLKGRNMPTNKQQMCVAACVGENLGFLKNGKVDVDNSIKTVESILGADNPKMPAVKEIANECSQISMPDRCESSSALYKCAVDGIKKRNLGEIL